MCVCVCARTQVEEGWMLEEWRTEEVGCIWGRSSQDRTGLGDSWAHSGTLGQCSWSIDASLLKLCQSLCTCVCVRVCDVHDGG